MTDNNHLSNKVALEILDEQIKELTEDVQELQEVISHSQKTTNSLIRDYNKKKIYLSKLQEKKIEIESMTNSYAFGIVDNYFESTEDKREQCEEEQEHINKDSKNRFIRLKGKQLSSTIERLQKKEGRISNIQKKLVNIKLKSQLRKIRRISKNEVLNENINSYLDKYSDVFRKNQEKFDEGKIIKKAISGSAMFISVAKYWTLEKYCNMLKIKNNIVEGAIALPPHIWEKIKEARKGAKRSSR